MKKGQQSLVNATGRNILVAADVKNPPCGPKGGEVKKQDRKS